MSGPTVRNLLSARSFDMDTSLLDSCGQSAHREDDRPAGAPQRPRLPPGGASRRQAVNLKALCIMLRERNLRAAMGQEEPSSRAQAPISPIEAAGTPNLAAHYQSDAALSRALTHSARVRATPASPRQRTTQRSTQKGSAVIESTTDPSSGAHVNLRLSGRRTAHGMTACIMSITAWLKH